MLQCPLSEYVFFVHASAFLPFRVAPFRVHHVDLAWLMIARSRVSFITSPKRAAVLSTPLNQRLLQLHISTRRLVVFSIFL